MLSRLKFADRTEGTDGSPLGSDLERLDVPRFIQVKLLHGGPACNRASSFSRRMLCKAENRPFLRSLNKSHIFVFDFFRVIHVIRWNPTEFPVEQNCSKVQAANIVVLWFEGYIIAPPCRWKKLRWVTFFLGKRTLRIGRSSAKSTWQLPLFNIHFFELQLHLAGEALIEDLTSEAVGDSFFATEHVKDVQVLGDVQSALITRHF